MAAATEAARNSDVIALTIFNCRFSDLCTWCHWPLQWPLDAGGFFVVWKSQSFSLHHWCEWTWWLWASTVYVLEYHAIFNLKIGQPRFWTTFSPPPLTTDTAQVLLGSQAGRWSRRLLHSPGAEPSKSYPNHTWAITKLYEPQFFAIIGRTPWTFVFLDGKSSVWRWIAYPIDDSPVLSRWMLSSCMATSTWEPWRWAGTKKLTFRLPVDLQTTWWYDTYRR